MTSNAIPDTDDLSWIDPEQRKHLSDLDIKSLLGYQRLVHELHDDTKIDIEAAYHQSLADIFKREQRRRTDRREELRAILRDLNEHDTEWVRNFLNADD